MQVLEFLVVHMVYHGFALVDLFVDITDIAPDFLAIHDLLQNILTLLLDFALVFVFHLLCDGVQYSINDLNSQ
jgi:hypothetical protein